MMTRSFWTRLGLLLTIPALLLLGACDAFTSDDDDHDDEEEHHDDGFARIQLETRDGSDEVVATWTDDDGWDVDALPSLEEGGEYAVWTVRMFAEDGDEIQLEEGGEYEARYAVDDEQDVIYFDDDGEVEIDGEEQELFHGDHIHVYPRNAGTTGIRILLWHNNHSDDSTEDDLIDVTVEEAGSDS